MGNCDKKNGWKSWAQEFFDIFVFFRLTSAACVRREREGWLFPVTSY